MKKILLGLLLAFLAIQLFRPEKNKSEVKEVNDIAAVYQVPAETGRLLQTSCYDCHSNNTNYPWYANIQPVAWWLNNHIVEGKEELNFSAFGTYSLKKQAHKLDEVAELVANGDMPLSSYTIIHGNAKLNDMQKKQLADWANSLKTQIEAKVK
ncbi:heme-binding domain-containing protein [Nubsella zeaxanthinifaciens]|uniref:heme-binding domain-containing protein n=1 Tax=Nubsella zeaxanthinifaciens TaxID=392412 RepID=UPI000DE1ED3F|nr:heme-binding domain-containing protein [Nubsella zeaxanthinifaciens]